MSRSAEPEFWFDQTESESPVMRGPGVRVTFTKARELIHSLRIDAGTGTADAGSAPWFLEASTAALPNRQDQSSSRIANPIYQELMPHELSSSQGTGICALLTGSGFDHHFSAVFSLFREHQAPDWITFEVDVADRCRGPVESLAATYLINSTAGAIKLKSGTQGALTWAAGGDEAGVLELIAVAPATISDDPSLHLDRTIGIHAQIDPRTHTQRLHYRWRWASCSEFNR
jgi:hypothetical protein